MTGLILFSLLGDIFCIFYGFFVILDPRFSSSIPLPFFSFGFMVLGLRSCIKNPEKRAPLLLGDRLDPFLTVGYFFFAFFMGSLSCLILGSPVVSFYPFFFWVKGLGLRSCIKNQEKGSLIVR